MQRALWIGMALFLCATSTLIAQTRSVSGIIADTSGAAVQGVTVTLIAPAVRQTTITDSTGAYRFRDVAPGTYQVVASLAGFSPVTRDNILVSERDVAVPQIVVVVAPLSETVVVSASKVETQLVN